MSRSHTRKYHNMKRRAVRRARSNGWVLKSDVSGKGNGKTGVTLWDVMRRERRQQVQSGG